MHEEIFPDLARGATLITVNTRLARAVARAFHARERERGNAVWRPPDILPLDAFLGRCWTECVWRGAARGLTLLTVLQEQVLWEQIIRASPSGESLLRIPETARGAADAWRLVQSYRLPVDARFEAADDWAAFAGWARDFEERCRANRWMEQARLSDMVARLFNEGELKCGAEVYLAGFDEITPQQADLFAALGNPVRVAPARFESVRMFSKFADAESEIRAVASWARALIENDPDTEAGIVVPDLAGLRGKIERAFRELGEKSFHVSLGAPLADVPLVHAALLILEFALAGLPLPSVGMLLRSPFVGGFDQEWTRRGLLDARLRRKGIWDVSASRLREETAGCAILDRNLARFQKLILSLPGEQRPSEWCRDFARLLDALGWPGERSLNSREAQAVQAWSELLSDLAALDLAESSANYDRAFSRLRQAAAARAFQVEDEGAPIQIMGLLEGAGLGFDHLWIMGLHDEALPFAAAPNPFLPTSLQREYELPHSSAEREIGFARGLLERLLASGPDVALSYPAADGDRVLNPCALVSEPVGKAPVAAAVSDWVMRIRAEASIEEFSDELAPPVQPGSEQRGGVSLFKDMAACPFRAFAKHRLSARPLEESMPGLRYIDRGNTVHRALQVIWTELQSHAQLCKLDAEELRGLIARAAEEAAGNIPHAIGGHLERQRLEKILSEWLEIEKLRDPFVVRALETDRLVHIGGLEVKMRADRVDELPSGRDIILDYKTGQLNSKAWESDRPNEPQLPLYCATSERPIAAAAFAQIRVGVLRFQGMAEPGAALPDMADMRVEELSLQLQIGRWREVLERLADNFRDGRADVDPKDGACEHCGQWGLCRIREFENA